MCDGTARHGRRTGVLIRVADVHDNVTTVPHATQTSPSQSLIAPEIGRQMFISNLGITHHQANRTFCSVSTATGAHSILVFASASRQRLPSSSIDCGSRGSLPMQTVKARPQSHRLHHFNTMQLLQTSLVFTKTKCPSPVTRPTRTPTAHIARLRIWLA